MQPAPSSAELATPTEARPRSGRRVAAAIGGVLVLTMPAALAAPLSLVQAKAATSVQAMAVRSALTTEDPFDRPSSSGLDAGQSTALSARLEPRVSRDFVRTAPGPDARESVVGLERLARAATATAKPKAASRRKPRSLAKARDRWVRPGNGRFTSGFKMRWGRQHKGIDLAAPTGSPIRAAADGVVIYAGPMQGFGRLVLIRHSSSLVTAYGHMSKYKTHVGAHVKAGEVIALVGSAGHSTGPHLHFEVRINGVQVNPVPFLAKHHVWV